MRTMTSDDLREIVNKYLPTIRSLEDEHDAQHMGLVMAREIERTALHLAGVINDNGSLVVRREWYVVVGQDGDGRAFTKGARAVMNRESGDEIVHVQEVKP